MILPLVSAALRRCLLLLDHEHLSRTPTTKVGGVWTPKFGAVTLLCGATSLLHETTALGCTATTQMSEAATVLAVIETPQCITRCRALGTVTRLHGTMIVDCTPMFLNGAATCQLPVTLVCAATRMYTTSILFCGTTPLNATLVGSVVIQGCFRAGRSSCRGMHSSPSDSQSLWR